MKDNEKGWRPRYRWPLVFGFAAMFLLLGILGVWSFSSRIAGAVVTSGDVELSADIFIIQSEVDGRVTQVNARNGDIVKEGQPLLKIDSTTVENELTILNRRTLELKAKRIRLVAEMLRFKFPDFQRPSDVDESLSETWEVVSNSEKTLFLDRADMVNQEIEELDQLLDHAEQKIQTIDRERAAAQKVILIIEENLSSLEVLSDKGLVTVVETRLALRDHALQTAELARIDQKRLLYEEEMLQVRSKKEMIYNKYREAAAVGILGIDAELAELQGRKNILSHRLLAHTIEAPFHGEVFDSKVEGLKTVVRFGDELMSVVPDVQSIQIRTRIQSADVNKVYSGQSVRLQFPSLNRREVPEFNGLIRSISAETITDIKTGAEVFELIIDVVYDELRQFSSELFIPGLPVQVLIQTSERRVIDYLVGPISEFFNRALREP